MGGGGGAAAVCPLLMGRDRSDYSGGVWGAQLRSHAFLLRADSVRGDHGDGRPVPSALSDEAHGQGAVLGFAAHAYRHRSADSVLVGYIAGAAAAGRDVRFPASSVR